MRQNDAQLSAAINQALVEMMNLSARDIVVKVNNGRATLQGFVDVLSEKTAAEDIVKRIPGITEVENGIAISYEGGPDDSEILAEVSRQIKNSEGASLLRQVEVDCHSGVISFNGHVGSLAQKLRLIRIAQGVLGVKDVHANLGIKPEAEIRTDDASLTNAVELALSRSGVVDPGTIVTTTEDGVVTLAGQVETGEQMIGALRTAVGIPGVKGLENRLEITRGDNEDAYWTAQLRSRLDTDHRVSPARIKAFVADRVAYLSGEVYTVEAKQVAEEIARSLAGIDNIRNYLAVARH